MFFYVILDRNGSSKGPLSPHDAMDEGSERETGRTSICAESIMCSHDVSSTKSMANSACSPERRAPEHAERGEGLGGIVSGKRHVQVCHVSDCVSAMVSQQR